MKLWLYLALLSTVFAEGEDVSGKFSEMKMCALGLFKVQCNFDASSSAFRRRLGGHEADSPKDIFSHCAIWQNGVQSGNFTQVATEQTELDFTNDQSLGDKAGYVTYVTALTVLDAAFNVTGPKVELLFKVQHKLSSGAYINTYSDFKVGWSLC